MLKIVKKNISKNKFCSYKTNVDNKVTINAAMADIDEILKTLAIKNHVIKNIMLSI